MREMANLKFTDELLIVATLLGPILAVQAQKFVERTTENRRRRLGIFHSLMATRAARVAPEHVQALNRIDLEFSGKRFFGLISWQTTRERAVVEAWREHFDRLWRRTKKRLNLPLSKLGSGHGRRGAMTPLSSYFMHFRAAWALDSTKCN
jgi:hypothetical protein